MGRLEKPAKSHLSEYLRRAALDEEEATMA